MSILKLKQLKNIQGNLAKQQFITDNKDDELFISILKFLLDDLIVSNISRKSWNKKVTTTPKIRITTVNQLLNYLTSCTGTDENLATLHTYLANFEPRSDYTQDYTDTIEVLEGIICKDYVTNVGIKMFNKEIPNNMINESGYMGERGK